MPEPERFDPFEQFDDLRQGAQDLIYLGYQTSTVEFCGQVFTFETIRPYLKYTIGQVLQPWRNTLSEPEVWAALHVGTSLTSINGDNSFCPPIQESPRAFIEDRLYWLTGPKGYLQPVINYLYAEYLKLEEEQFKIIQKTYSLSKEVRDTSQPSPDTSTVPGSLYDRTGGVTQPVERSN